VFLRQLAELEDDVVRVAWEGEREGGREGDRERGRVNSCGLGLVYGKT